MFFASVKNISLTTICRKTYLKLDFGETETLRIPFQAAMIGMSGNDPRDSYAYEVIIYTGYSPGSGTTARVFLTVTGDKDETLSRCVPNPNATRFLEGGEDRSLLTVPRDLGEIQAIKIWHNNEGTCLINMITYNKK